MTSLSNCNERAALWATLCFLFLVVGSIATGCSIDARPRSDGGLTFAAGMFFAAFVSARLRAQARKDHEKLSILQGGI